MKDKNNAITLINCPRIWPRLPHLGLASISAYLKSRGIQNQVIDLNQYFYHKTKAEIKKIWEIPVYPAFSEKIWDFLKINHKNDFDQIIDTVLNNSYQYIGFSVWHSNKFFTNKLAQLIKEKSPDKMIVFGGPEITLQYNYNKNLIQDNFPDADIFVVGEGELPLLNILSNPESSKLFYSAEIGDLDSIPAPDFSQSRSYKYIYPKTYPIWMNRGCIRKCLFCVEHTLHNSFRSKSPDKIVAELMEFNKNDGTEYFVFYDSLINGDLIKFEHFLDLLIKSETKIKWESQILIRNDMTDELFHKIKQSGCYNLFVGLESGCDRILKLMRKGFTTTEAEIFFKKCYSANLHFEISMIFGFPSETELDFQETASFLKKNSSIIPKIAQINPYLELSGSPLSLSSPNNQNISINEIESRIDRTLTLCKKNNIRYTPSYINNLMIYNAGFDAQTGSVINNGQLR